MFSFFRKRKIEKLERKLCDLKAQLEATHVVLKGIRSDVPVWIVEKAIKLPGEIAALEKQIEQLKG